MIGQNYIQVLNHFVPACEQELDDHKIIMDLITQYPDTILTRKNPVAHLTASAFILNSQRDKCLMVYHNLYHSWSWSGGHADGDPDLFAVACREAHEETGIIHLNPLSSDIISLDILPVFAHIKHQNHISTHLHLSVAYAFVANDSDPLKIKPDENSAVSWIPIKALDKQCSEDHMLQIYHKILKKVENL
ncbi:MAG: NUDIX hydrolase [Eubacterium sp.]